VWVVKKGGEGGIPTLLVWCVRCMRVRVLCSQTLALRHWLSSRPYTCSPLPPLPFTSPMVLAVVLVAGTGKWGTFGGCCDQGKHGVRRGGRGGERRRSFSWTNMEGRRTSGSIPTRSSSFLHVTTRRVGGRGGGRGGDGKERAGRGRGWRQGQRSVFSLLLYRPPVAPQCMPQCMSTRRVPVGVQGGVPVGAAMRVPVGV
jgi:hypothetical protein